MKYFLVLLSAFTLFLSTDVRASVCVNSMEQVSGVPNEKASENLAYLLLEDPTINSRFGDNPYLAALIFFKYLSPDATPVSQKVAQDLFERAQGQTTPEEMAQFHQYLQDRLSKGDVRASALKEIEDITEINVETFKNKTTTGMSKFISKSKDYIAQLKALPMTLKTIREYVEREMDPGRYDENVFAFWGFHHVLDDTHFKMRTWNKAPLGNVSPKDVHGIGVAELAAYMQIAMEVEDPIDGYMQESGQGLRYLMDTFARFMGKKEEESKLALETGDAPLCEGGWCREEQRHGPMFARLIERILGADPGHANPGDVLQVSPDEDSALEHLDNRQSAEWNASSSYIFMSSHIDGGLNDVIRNILRDELKHLTLTSVARLYLRGNTPNARLAGMLKKSISELRDTSGRSTGAQVGKNPITLFEILYAHILVEAKVRKYLDMVPLVTMRRVFETETELPPLKAYEVSDEKRLENNRLLEENRQKRLELARWPKGQRERALEQERLEAKNAAQISEIIQTRFNDFAGAEVPNSPADQQMRMAFLKFATSTTVNWDTDSPNEILFRILVDRLRDYQITNNGYVRSKARS